MNTPIADSPEQVPRLFVQAWNDRDPDGIAALFEDDADFVNVTGIWWTDRQSIRDAHAYGLERIFSASRLLLGKVKVRRLTPRIAVVHSRMILDGQTAHPGTARPGRRVTIFSFVVTLADAGWRCVSAHNTDVVPGAETHIRDPEGELRAVDYRKDEDPES
jgi:uncharacterized protein (TIGR02246 family)